MQQTNCRWWDTWWYLTAKLLVLLALTVSIGIVLFTNTFIHTGEITSSDTVAEEFKAGFTAGVRWGILSYMQNPGEDSFDFHLKYAQKWYWLVVVDDGKTLRKAMESSVND